jgi:hypothetical protein
MINIYWACIENEWLRAQPPVAVSKVFYQDRKYSQQHADVNMHHCPAFNNHLTNMFALRSLYSYQFNINGNNVTSPDYDQEFFSRHVNIKSIEKRLFSFNQSFIFFTELNSLPATLSLPPYLENNNITARCTILPGELDIGRWFRNTDMAFYLKSPYDDFIIEEGEIFAYIKFHTDEKINFIQYRQTDKLNSMLLDTIRSKNNKKNVFSMGKFYSLFNTKKIILKEIKENLLDTSC